MLRKRERRRKRGRGCYTALSCTMTVLDLKTHRAELRFRSRLCVSPEGRCQIEPFVLYPFFNFNFTDKCGWYVNMSMCESHKTGQGHASPQNQKKKRNRIMLKPILEPPITLLLLNFWIKFLITAIRKNIIEFMFIDYIVSCTAFNLINHFITVFYIVILHYSNENHNLINSSECIIVNKCLIVMKLTKI